MDLRNVGDLDCGLAISFWVTSTFSPVTWKTSVAILLFSVPFPSFLSLLLPFLILLLFIKRTVGECGQFLAKIMTFYLHSFPWAVKGTALSKRNGVSPQ
jgi:hypothetical protein